MVSRTRDGTFQLRIGDDERDLLASLAGQLRELLVGDQTDGLERLFPPGYANDPDREQEYQQLTHDELLTKRLASVDILEQTVNETRLDEDQLNAWMGAVNDLRLVLGTRLDVTEDMDIELDDPRASAFAVYQYLTHVLAEIVNALGGY
ncbi:MAG: hypothetical protein QOC92_2803 [Acidimicrobiaceae bacterium]|jgi:hypothetical protein